MDMMINLYSFALKAREKDYCRISELFYQNARCHRKVSGLKKSYNIREPP
jgi:hypothetical protein